MRSWLDAGLHPAASSDAPVCETNMMANLHAMVTRRTAAGRVLGADQRISMAEAIHASTYNGAYLSFSESVKGRLLPGQLADIAVADRDIFAVQPEQLLEAKIDLTVLDGAVAYDRLGEVSA